jgi:hypothetical protein
MDFCVTFKSVRGSMDNKYLGYTLEDLVFKSWTKQEYYLFSKTSSSAPAPTQPPTQ